MLIENFPNIVGNRSVCLISVNTLADLVAMPPPLTRHFVLVLAADLASSSDEILYQLATDLIVKGVSYACCWGSDCERMEVSFDWADIATNDATSDVLMTTSHPDEDLSEAIWFGVTVAFPTDRYAADTGTVVVATVGSDSWSNLARAYLSEGAPVRGEA